MTATAEARYEAAKKSAEVLIADLLERVAKDYPGATIHTGHDWTGQSLRWPYSIRVTVEVRGASRGYGPPVRIQSITVTRSGRTYYDTRRSVKIDGLEVGAIATMKLEAKIRELSDEAQRIVAQVSENKTAAADKHEKAKAAREEAAAAGFSPEPRRGSTVDLDATDVCYSFAGEREAGVVVEHFPSGTTLKLDLRFPPAPHRLVSTLELAAKIQALLDAEPEVTR